MRIYVGLGSNLGDRKRNLLDAVSLLGERTVKFSSIYETEPVGLLEQPWFLNAVVQVQTELSARELLVRCQQVEIRLGRQRLIPKGPRVIDLDILFYGDLEIRTPDLEVPHPAIPERRFVLLPMNEIASDFVHPVLGKTISELLSLCADRSIVRRIL